MNCPIETHQFLNSWKENSSELYQKYSTSWINDEEKGYFGFLPKNTTALFIGTFPVPEQRTTGFFYHSDANLFWKLLKELSGTNLNSLEQKLNWLSDLKLGITDILYKAQRIDENCSSRADTDLNAICLNNVLKLLSDYPSIEDIYLTSGGPSSRSLSGKSAGGWLGEHIRKETKRSIKRISSDGATLRVKLQPSGREYNLHYLITPAPQDNQLGKFLRENENVRTTLDQINFFKELKDNKEKYKAIQWACYLSNIQGLLSEKIKHEVLNQRFCNLLMERK
jgi:hypothetical protein